MDRRRYLATASAPGGSLVGGCLGRWTDDASEPSADGRDGDGGPENALRIGQWGQVTERTATQPDELRFSDRVVFERAYRDEDVVWTAADGFQYLLVYVGLKTTDAPDGKLVSQPDPFQYRARIDGQTYPPLPSPQETNAIVEPAEGGYVTGGGKGAEGSSSWGVIAFEVPDDATKADVRIRYEDGADGEPLVWVPDAARDGGD